MPPDDDDETGKQFKAYRNLYVLGSIGIQLVVSIIIGFAVGLMLDKWLGTAPWMMLAFLLLGIAAGFLNMFRVAMKSMGVDPAREHNGVQNYDANDEWLDIDDEDD